MKKIFFLSTLLLLFIANHAFAQSKEALRQKIKQIIATKKATVGVSIVGAGGREEVSVNGNRHFPMQSVFKFHIALKMLSEIDKGNFSLDQKIEIQKKDYFETYSPIRDKYPEGVTLTISEILEYMVSASDNVGCDVLLGLLGGPQTVEKYFVKNKFKDLSIKVTERQTHAERDLQYQNWTTPKAANKVLKAFYDNKKERLSAKSYAFLWKLLRETSTGNNRLKGQLPENTVVAHKPGTSGVDPSTGIRAAVNDIGIVFLPNGKHFFISVFVTDSKENLETEEKIIADIANSAWDYFSTKTK
ncbi:MAG: class A beta-lactamase, subclass A2 [Pyrinomonadaceae bacterium]